MRYRETASRENKIPDCDEAASFETVFFYAEAIGSRPRRRDITSLFELKCGQPVDILSSGAHIPKGRRSPWKNLNRNPVTDAIRNSDSVSRPLPHSLWPAQYYALRRSRQSPFRPPHLDAYSRCGFWSSSSLLSPRRDGPPKEYATVSPLRYVL